MGIILQVGLTIWAWNRGWKAFALIPLGVTMVIGFLIGVTSPDAQTLESRALVVDILCYLAIIAMIIFKKPE